MSEGSSTKTAGLVLVGAAVVGVVAIAIFSPATSGVAPAAGKERSAATTPPTREPGTSEPTGRFVAPVVAPERERFASPFSEPATDSAAARCAATVREQIAAAGGDSTGVVIAERYGVHPPPGRGPDSLVVEGTARAVDSTRAVWHCAATRYPSGEVATLTAVLEEGWPGIAAGFDAAHAVTLAAEEMCLQRVKPLFPEYVFRGVKVARVADALNVRGETIPLNSEDLAGDFHCRAIVRDGGIVSAEAKAGR